MPKKQKAIASILEQILIQKSMDYPQFATSRTSKTAQNAAPGALLKNASNLEGFWDAFFRIFMDLGSQIGGQNRPPKKQFVNFLLKNTPPKRNFPHFPDFQAIISKYGLKI